MVGRLGVLESKLWLGKTTDGEVKPVYLTKRNSLTTDLRYAMEITEDNAKYFLIGNSNRSKSSERQMKV